MKQWLHAGRASSVDVGPVVFCGSAPFRPDLSGVNLLGLDLRGADLSYANLSNTFISFAYLTRASLEWADLSGTYLNGANLSEARLFSIQSDRAQIRGRYKGIALFASVLVAIYGLVYSMWPKLLNYAPDTHDWFTPSYFSIVRSTILGFGDINPKGHWAGDVIVSSEVILGYTTLGLLLAVLAEKIARRS